MDGLLLQRSDSESGSGFGVPGDNRREWIGGSVWARHTLDACNGLVTRSAVVRVDGVELPGVEIDTDPNVYTVGASLRNNGAVTADLPRRRSTSYGSSSRTAEGTIDVPVRARNYVRRRGSRLKVRI